MAITRRRALAAIAGVSVSACVGGSRSAKDSAPQDFEGFLPIGGIEQWVAIRGAGKGKPALLFLHGGPGEALSPFPAIFEPLQRDFTVALWDQRGAGRTFGRNRDMPASQMSLDRLAADAVEISDHLRRMLGREKIIIAGQSFGSIVAWTAARTRPDLFSAYVGTGQSVSWPRAVAWQEAFARAAAQATGDREAIAAMDEAQAKFAVNDFRRTGPLRKWIFPPADLAFLDMQKAFAGAPCVSEEEEVADWINGFGFSAEHLSPIVSSYDIYGSGPAAPLPVIVVQGADDHITPTPVVRQFVDDLGAPAKSFATIEGGHFACYTNGEAFASAVRKGLKAAPLAKTRQAAVGA